MKHIPPVSALAVAVVGIASIVMSSAQVSGQQNGQSDPSLIRVNGLVLQQQKYSFTMRGLDRDYRVVVPNGTPLLMKLTWPQLDFDKRELSVELPLSAVDGLAENNLRLTYPLSKPIYLSADFPDRESRDRVPDQGVRDLERFVLSPRPFTPDELAIQGRLRPSQIADQFKLENDVMIFPVRLGGRKGLLANASIMQLRPHETEVFVEGQFDGDALVASRIRFQHVGDPFARFDSGLPNALVLGDFTSINYDQALRTELAGRMNVHHPPVTCGGSQNWRAIHRWVANPDGDTRRWGAIAFNFGLRDKSLSEVNWKSNLRNAIKELETTGSKLVWVTTTPVPNGYPEPANGGMPLGLVQGRMQLQNQWAAEVLQGYPQIQVCDLWQVVKDNSDGVFDDWWAGNSLRFDDKTSQPLGQAVARALEQAAGQ